MEIKCQTGVGDGRRRGPGQRVDKWSSVDSVNNSRIREKGRESLDLFSIRCCCCWSDRPPYKSKGNYNLKLPRYGHSTKREGASSQIIIFSTSSSSSGRAEQYAGYLYGNTGCVRVSADVREGNMIMLIVRFSTFKEDFLWPLSPPSNCPWQQQQHMLCVGE